MLHKSLVMRPSAAAAVAAAANGKARVSVPLSAVEGKAPHAHASRDLSPSSKVASRSAKLPTVGFVGFGVMAKAMTKGMQTAPKPIFSRYALCDNSKKQLETHGVTTAPVVTTNKVSDDVLLQSDVLVLAVKPQALAKVLARIPPRRDQLLISIVAGWSIERILENLSNKKKGEHPRVIRTMPNTPLCVGKGCTLYARCPHATPEDVAIVESMFGSCGITAELNESQLDAATGIAGSGPSYVALFMEALADGAVMQGLPRDLALKLAAHTVEGAAAMCTEAGGGLHPAILKDRVCSPGGTSIHGVTELENHGVRKAIIAAVAGAAKRSRDLNKL